MKGQSSNKKHRTIIFYKDYFEKFFVKQPQRVKDKIIWTFNLIEEIERVPVTYLKHIESTEVLTRIKTATTLRVFLIPPVF